MTSGTKYARSWQHPGSSWTQRAATPQHQHRKTPSPPKTPPQNDRRLGDGPRLGSLAPSNIKGLGGLGFGGGCPAPSFYLNKTIKFHDNGCPGLAPSTPSLPYPNICKKIGESCQGAAKMVQERARIAPRWFKMGPRWPKMARRLLEMAPRWLQII